MYSTMEIHYNTNKKIEKCYLSNFYNKKALKQYNMMRYYKSKKKIQHQISNKKNNVTFL